MNGEQQVRGTGEILVGPGRLLDPTKFAHVFVSPRRRARRTYDLLFAEEGSSSTLFEQDGRVTVTEEIAEWDYGDYEGLRTGEIRARRKGKGLDGDRPWDIWRDGCEGGE